MQEHSRVREEKRGGEDNSAEPRHNIYLTIGTSLRAHRYFRGETYSASRVVFRVKRGNARAFARTARWPTRNEISRLVSAIASSSIDGSIAPSPALGSSKLLLHYPRDAVTRAITRSPREPRALC